MPGRSALLLALSAAACARVEDGVDLQIPAEGLDRLVVTVDRGDVEVVGDDPTAFVVEGTSIGYGANENQAGEREDGNEVTLVAEGSDAVLESTSEFKRAWVDLEVSCPAVVDLDVWIKRGSAHLENIEGQHLVTADRITSRALMGSVDLLATAGGLDVDVWPWTDGEVLVESSAGDAILRLPYGGAYDLEVIGDPAWEMVIEDLGFHTTYQEPGYFAGTVGDGSIRVLVYVNGGSFQLLESL